MLFSLGVSSKWDQSFFYFFFERENDDTCVLVPGAVMPFDALAPVVVILHSRDADHTAHAHTSRERHAKQQKHLRMFARSVRAVPAGPAALTPCSIAMVVSSCMIGCRRFGAGATGRINKSRAWARPVPSPDESARQLVKEIVDNRITTAKKDEFTRGGFALPLPEDTRALNVPLCDRFVDLGRAWIASGAARGLDGEPSRRHEQQQAQARQQQQQQQQQPGPAAAADTGGASPALAAADGGEPSSPVEEADAAPEEGGDSVTDDAFSDGNLLRRCSFTTAAAHAHGGALQLHIPLVVQDDADIVLPLLCRAVARLHGSSLRSDASCKPVKVQQTVLPALAALTKAPSAKIEFDDDIFDAVHARIGAGDSAALKKSAHDDLDAQGAARGEITVVSSADVVDDKLCVVTVVAYRGRGLDPELTVLGRVGQSTQATQVRRRALVHTTAAMRMYYRSQQSLLVVPEPPVHHHHHHHHHSHPRHDRSKFRS